MSAALLVLVGAVLCFLGAFSVRVAVLAAGFGTGWLLATALGASTTTVLLVAGAGAVVSFVSTYLLSAFLFFVAGVVVGSVVGARLFVVVDRGDSDWLLSVVFVPAVAVVCGLLADRWRQRFLGWATAAAGSALLLSGIGRLGTDSTGWYWRPDTATGTTVFAVSWLVLTLVGHRVQLGSRRDQPAS
ncbi:hypothetical protein [Nocardioides lianchengensis]|uniref:DUF4203 domain-containing protein n=1 Tax=Nocardioides lianchengensis TaxID=1045774 RepID=A0A1G6W2E2_9ACTN|nr:hypothetical protein [Nocardioides lianchengensis]NYG09464.1 hypothetical protein [Nocardioides lianchengensis]SDD60011.1 hypothetical protein SAMN05421872_109144 [Nocardioides lianchengensis]